ncbi:hypothetical protein AB0P21_21680 [Kribbella sp. NPDC056861]|uniref:hypothetical protein n=1 Tax=Kribbella sp. NPDC056861 TaxID=3154857 RepID=UPI003415534F
MYKVERDRAKRMRWPRRLPEVPSRVWSDDEWQRLQRGYQAGAMEEKWNVFTEGRTVFCHRSWTGMGYFEVTFAPVESGGWRMVEGKVARDRLEFFKRLLSRRRRDSDAFDLVLLELVLSAIVLGEPARELREKLDELVRRQEPDPDSIPAGYVEHIFLGSRSEEE